MAYSEDTKVRSVFLSYRRDDTAGTVGRVHDRLRAVLPDLSIFLDVDDIAPGLDFAEAMYGRLSESDVVLVFIGKAWEARQADGSRRIDDPEDHVRQEAASALAGGTRVIPVLVDRPAMPRAKDLPADLAGLPRLNASVLRHASFAQDLGQLFSEAFGVHAGVETSKAGRFFRLFAGGLAGYGVTALALVLLAIAHREVTGKALNTTIGNAGTLAFLIVAAAFGTWLSRRFYRWIMRQGA
ncbi:MAG: toll/interleukin-1 receptor domain-containing protein [Rhodobiaceae bacterium]|nr:toll/interleukin-1 receptor domain-containing protein [Rhodobiaceae bacterium]MCC0048896.1 toll/interleukin-1 receptor domain-containing protein [Rhodobiaceae bacterium]